MLWEISENLHRAELTILERSDLEARWIVLTEKEQKEKAAAQQPAQVAPPVRKRGHAQEGGGVNAAVRDLGIDRTEAQRAVKIAALSQEAKEAARETRRDNNQSALLAATKAAPEEQARVIREYQPAARVKPAPDPLNDLETEEQWMSAIMRVWNRGAPQWRERFMSTVDSSVFDSTPSGKAA